MITVNAWYPHGDNVGHASAQIGNHAYVSWWPSGAHWKQRQPGLDNTFEGDVRSEADRQPDERVHVRRLDEVAAAAWWRALLDARGQYQAAGQNCAWAVISALKAGGADERIGWTHALSKYNVPLGVLAPGLCALALAPAAAGAARQKIGWVNHCTPFWTPADAIAYAKAIR